MLIASLVKLRVTNGEEYSGESADNSPIFKPKLMHNARKKEAKKSARTKKSGVQLVKASERQAKKAGKNFSASGGRKYAKSVTSAQTAAAFEKEGSKRIATGKKTAKKKDLKVTPRSARKSAQSKDPYLKSQKKGAGRATTTRPKRKK